MSNLLRVMAWDDARCVAPLTAAAQSWQELKGTKVQIERRPLTAFNDQPLTELVSSCDVMIIDHPHVPKAVAEGILLPFDSLVDEQTLALLAKDALPNCYASYIVDGQVYGMASDAACQVSAYRPAALAQLNAPLPRTWDDIFSLAEAHPGSVALSLHHADTFCCLISLLAGQHVAPTGGNTLFPDQTAAVQAINILQKLVAVVPEICWEANPPTLFDHANRSNSIAYTPFTFGYVRLTHPLEGGWRFSTPPVGSGSILGGAGMAISAGALEPEMAAAFATWYTMPHIQTFLTMNGAQPGSQRAWQTPMLNQATGNFFSDTYQTIANAYTRPQTTWWPAVHKECGMLFVKLLRQERPTAEIVQQLEACYAQHYNSP